MKSEQVTSRLSQPHLGHRAAVMSVCSLNVGRAYLPADFSRLRRAGMPALRLSVFLLIACLALPALGQSRVPPAGELGDNKTPPPAEVEQVNINQNVGIKLPLDTPFMNEQGKPVKLGDYFNNGEKPVLLEFVYFDCPALCPLMQSGVAEAVNNAGWTPGEQFEIVMISINPNDRPTDAVEFEKRALAMLDNPDVADGWHYLTGREVDIKSVADYAGFGYSFVPRTNDYAHAAVAIFVSPDGTISRYLSGDRYPTKDFKMALVEASQGKQGSVIDMILQRCYHWDPTTGQYTVQAMALMKLGGVVTMLTLGGLIGFMLLLERKRKKNEAHDGSSDQTPPDTTPPTPQVN